MLFTVAVDVKIIEAAHDARGGNWGKFQVSRWDAAEWERGSAVDTGSSRPLLAQLGWSPAHLWVMDLQTGEAACVYPGGAAHADLNKHRVWVCPLFEPFLQWLYGQDLTDLPALPDVVYLPQAPFALHGYRRPGYAAGEGPRQRRERNKGRRLDYRRFPGQGRRATSGRAR